MGKRSRRILAMYHHVVDFLLYGVWSMPIDELPRRKSRLFSLLRVVLLVRRGTLHNRIQLRASALTFYTLMTLVPTLALCFALAKGVGMETRLVNFINEKLVAYPELAGRLVDMSSALLARTGGGVLAGVGVIMLLWSVLRVFGHIEKAFNAIWQVERSRTWIRKFTDYFSMTLIMPIIFLVASSANVFLRTIINQPEHNTQVISMIRPYMLILLRILPSFLICLVFGFFYIIMPNTKVKLRSGLISGLVAGLTFSIVEWAYLYFQFGVSRYNAIYGSFAAIPLFLVFTQLSWVILLMGAELSYAMQNTRLYEFEQETRFLCQKRRKELSLLLLSTLVSRFQRGDTPFTSEQLAELHGLPLRLTRALLKNLHRANLLIPLSRGNHYDETYQPCHPVEYYTMGNILAAYEQNGETIDAHGEMLSTIENLSLQQIQYILKDQTPITTKRNESVTSPASSPAAQQNTP